MREPATKLTSRQIMFAHEYVKNGGRAKMAAMSVGVREEVASPQACRWLDVRYYPLVVAEVDRLMVVRQERAVISGTELVSELTKVIRFNPQDLVDEHGEPVPLHELPREVAASLRQHKVKVRVLTDQAGNESRSVSLEAESWNKLEAIRQAAQHLGLTGTSTTVNVQNNNANVMAVDWDKMTPGDEGADAVEERINKVGNTQVNGTNGTNGEVH